MAIPMRHDQHQDADAVYINDKIASADRLEAEGRAEEQSGSSKRKQAEQERIQAGQRLIEVRNKVSQDKEKSGDPNAPGWLAWLRTNDIPESTARNLMKLAGDTPEQREEKKAKDAERKRDERAKQSYSVEVVLNSVYPQHANYSGTDKRELKEQLVAIHPEILKRENEELLRAEAFKIFALRHPDHFGQQREALPEKMEIKVSKAIAIETAKLHQSYHEEVEKGIKAQLADRLAHLEQLREKAAARVKRYDLLIAGIKPVISKDDYRFLLGTFHSDRTPSKEKLEKAFIIVKKLEPYIETA